MSRGLGKIEKEVLRICCKCFFAKDEIIKPGDGYGYPGGVRFISSLKDRKYGEYIRIAFLGGYRRRILLKDEWMIDLKEVHYFYRKKFGKPSQTYQDLISFGIKERKATLEEAKEVAIAYCRAFNNMRDPEKRLSESQEAAYQRAVKSLKKKDYLEFFDSGYPTNRFVTINQKKIKPVKSYEQQT